MDGFKDSTKTQRGHSAAKISKVMHEFKTGKLHSGKDGPIATIPKQGIAIALSESRLKKADGGAVARGNRVQAEEAAEDRVIDRSRTPGGKPRFDTAKAYSDPDAKQERSELSRRLARAPKPGYSGEPLISRAAGALGLKKGGLAVKGCK